MKLENYLKYLQHFSLITIGDNKAPNFKWKNQQNIKLEADTFVKHYNSTTTKGVGIVTGFEDLEVIDVDLKVFSTTTEKEKFWSEYLSILRDAIFDFDDKFVIYKTKNAGYHILYKTKRVGKNQKIAVLQGHTEAIIETRGVGGYVFMYPENQISKKSYFDVQYISDADWQTLMNVSKSYNFVKKEVEKIDVKIKKDFPDSGLKSWDDFNAQTDIWDVISDEFIVVRDTSDKTFIKRHGSTNFHSGIIYKNENLAWIFSTGTIYPHERQISPYVAYTYKYHNGDFSASAKDLYEQGFGDRLKREIDRQAKGIKTKQNELIEDIKINHNDLSFPIDIFPKNYQDYILECNEKLGSVIDYMGCTLIYVTSIILGNCFSIKVKNGWNENPIVWMSLVGEAGVGKSPSIDRIIYPLKQANSKEIKKYLEQKKKYDEYSSLSKKEKEQQIEIKLPKKKQFIVDDVTLEALVDLMENSKNGIGLFKDELSGWIKDMNKYREGSDMEFWLSSWNGNSYFVNRLTRVGSFVEHPFVSILGGIQPEILNTMYDKEKKDNGFMDRMLISYPDVTIDYFSEGEISHDAIEWFRNSIIDFKKNIDQIIQYEEEEIKKYVASFDKEAKAVWIKKFNEITDLQNSENESEYFKSMYPKQKSYIPRFAFIINSLHENYNRTYYFETIKAQSVESAIKLSNYFVAHAKKIKQKTNEASLMHKQTKSIDSTFDKVISLYKSNKDFNKTEAGRLFQISRQTINNYIKKYEESLKTEK